MGRAVWIGAILGLLAIPAAVAVEVQAVRLWRAPDHTRIVFDLSGPAQHKLILLDNPSRIVLDLKGKLDFEDEAQIMASGGIEADVIAALTALGYSTAEARRGLVGLSLDEGENLEDMIRQALQTLSAGRG